MKVTGKLPLVLFSAGGFHSAIDLCPLCAAGQVGLKNALLECPGTRHFFESWWSGVHIDTDPTSVDWEELQMENSAAMQRPALSRDMHKMLKSMSTKIGMPSRRTTLLSEDLSIEFDNPNDGALHE